MVTSLFTDNLIIQTAVFVVSSILLILFTRPIINKYVNNKTVPTNIYSFIGKRGIVTSDINSSEGTGQVKVDGEIWSAKTDNDEFIPKGKEIEVTAIDGVKAVVTLCKDTTKV